jgi:hypothetical protein
MAEETFASSTPIQIWNPLSSDDQFFTYSYVDTRVVRILCNDFQVLHQAKCISHRIEVHHYHVHLFALQEIFPS